MKISQGLVSFFFFFFEKPQNFQPDPDTPEAHPYEGLLLTNQANIPETTEDWKTPKFDLSVYDGDFASWRAILPYHYISSVTKAVDYYATLVYQYDTILDLPNLWNVTYEPRAPIEVYISGKANLCGEDFENAKNRDENS